MLYYNVKKQKFENLKRPSKTNYKILLTTDKLKNNMQETIQPGQYITKISNLEFVWHDLKEILVNPSTAVRVYNPYNENDIAFLD